MPIAFANLGQNAAPDLVDTSNVATYRTASWTPPTSGVIVLVVGTAGPSNGTAEVPSVSGNGLTWTRIAGTDIGFARYRVDVFVASAQGGTAGATTIGYGRLRPAARRASSTPTASIRRTRSSLGPRREGRAPRGAWLWPQRRGRQTGASPDGSSGLTPTTARSRLEPPGPRPTSCSSRGPPTGSRRSGAPMRRSRPPPPPGHSRVAGVA